VATGGTTARTGGPNLLLPGVGLLALGAFGRKLRRRA
jgi:hypothetical protein